jgi:membrane-associated phospholipid phosphatase
VNAITQWASSLRSPQSLPLFTLVATVGALFVYGSLVGQAAWEVELTRGIQAASPAPLRWLARAMTVIGNEPIYALMAVAGVAALLWARHAPLAVLVALAAMLRMISTPLMDLVGRERPSAGLADVANQLSTPAFPSGHVLGATLLFGVLVYAVEIAVPRTTIKRWLQATLVSMIVLMGYARVELGEHWPTDVLGGWAIGALLLVFLFWAHRAFAPVRNEPSLRSRHDHPYRYR